MPFGAASASGRRIRVPRWESRDTGTDHGVYAPLSDQGTSRTAHGRE